MKNCVNIIWKNGFGNQLFQYTYGRLLSEQMECSLTYSGTASGWEGTSLIDIKFLNVPDDIIKYTSENIKVNIDYNKQQAVELETPSNYEFHLEEIRSWFPIVEKTNMDDLVIHLRIGDNGSNIYTPFTWYKKAIEDNEIEFNKIYLVTDTPESKDVVKFKSYYNAELVSKVTFVTIEDRKNYKLEVVNDFNFIRQFDKILFSNSTFPWWASVLSDASRVWFNKEWQPNHYNGMIKLGETNYKNWKGIMPFSLKEN